MVANELDEELEFGASEVEIMMRLTLAGPANPGTTGNMFKFAHRQYHSE